MVYIRRAEVNDYEAIQKLFLEKTVYRPKSDGSMDPERLLKQRYGNNIDAAFHM